MKDSHADVRNAKISFNFKQYFLFRVNVCCVIFKEIVGIIVKPDNGFVELSRRKERQQNCYKK